jgi:hypothetical protein
LHIYPNLWIITKGGYSSSHDESNFDGEDNEKAPKTNMDDKMMKMVCA